MQKRLAEIGQEMPSAEQMTPAGFGAFHKAEMDKWTPIIKAANIKPEGTVRHEPTVLEKTQTIIRVTGNLPPLIVRRIDAIPVALPLKAPMKMAGVTITKAENLIVRVELQDGQVGWGEAPSAPTMTGDTLGSLVAAVRDHLAPLLIGKDRPTADHRPMLQRALVGNTGAHSAVEMALLDAACRATNSRLIDVAIGSRRAH